MLPKVQLNIYTYKCNLKCSSSMPIFLSFFPFCCIYFYLCTDKGAMDSPTHSLLPSLFEKENKIFCERKEKSQNVCKIRQTLLI